jgi:hypothetical protein
MKITKWWKKLATSLIVAGAVSPGLSHAASIALADPGFEVYAHTSGTSHEGFATLDYNTTAFTNNYTTGYRKPDASHLQSAWVDDPGFAGFDGLYQDDDEAYHGSNFLFRSGTTGSGTRNRPQPRGNTGSNLQAMHGYYHYNGQIAPGGAVFEAGKTYKFSVYAQGNTNNSGNYGSYINKDGTWFSSVNLYIFDGTTPGYDGVTTGLGSPGGALASQFYEPACPQATNAACLVNHPIGDFTNRGSTVVGTQADTNPAVPLTTSTASLGWTQISLYHYVAPGAPEVGHAIGVAFYGYFSANVDDASLEVFPGNVAPEPGAATLMCMAGVSFAGLAARRRRRTEEDRGPG